MQIFKTKASFALIAEIVERFPTIPWEGGRTLGKLNGRVELSHVKFQYPTRDAIVLSDLSLSVDPGQTVALVLTSYFDLSSIQQVGLIIR